MIMQRFRILSVVVLFGLSALVTLAYSADTPAAESGADDSQHKFELARQYYGECTNTEAGQFDAIKPQLQAFTDMEVMAATMADPARFSQLMAVVNDPRTIHVMTKCATEPVMWDTWMRGMTDFNKMSRAMAYFMNPNMYFNWMMAPMNPSMYQPAMQMMQPQYYTRWSNAMMNPAFYQPMTSMAQPGWYAPRIDWMMNPQSMQPMFNMMNMPGMQPMYPGAAVAEPAQ